MVRAPNTQGTFMPRLTLLRVNLAALALALVGVTTQFSCGPSTCNPANTGDCATGLECDPVTKACVTPSSCSNDAACPGGYACGATEPKKCFVNCAALGSGTDIFCKAGSKCSATFTCDVITGCTPDGSSSFCNGGQCDATTKTCAPAKVCAVDADCGNFGCSLSECYASCARDTQCATGKTCNTTTNKCQ
jgi:hypothetical protein